MMSQSGWAFLRWRIERSRRQELPDRQGLCKCSSCYAQRPMIKRHGCEAKKHPLRLHIIKRGVEFSWQEPYVGTRLLDGRCEL